MIHSWKKHLKTQQRWIWNFKRVESYFLLTQDYVTIYNKRRVHILIRNSYLYIMYRRKTWILGTFGDPREFSQHRKAVLNNLIEAIFHYYLLLKSVWSGILKTSAFYPFFSAFTHSDKHKYRMQNTVWGEYPIFEERAFQ